MKKLILNVTLGLLLLSQQLLAQQISLSGNVTDEKGETLIGVTVQIKGTSNGTITDIDGNYTLSSVSAQGEVIFSYMGYNTVTKPINNQTIINVVLTEDIKRLDEVVVVGFGTQKKVNLTGAVSSVSSDALENRPVANIGQALQGIVPNLNVSSISADPSAAPSFNVRGGTSMAYNTDKKKWEVKEGSPLILVDGIQMDANYLNMMNPNDIENISVLKDAAASAIYGARATYGVMLITTKGGKTNQKARVEYSFNMQWSTPTQLPKLLDAYTIQLASNKATEMTQGTVGTWEQTLLEAKKAWRDNPDTAPAWMYDQSSNSKFVWLSSYNPYDMAVRDWTPTNNHTVNVSGGNEKTRYYISLGYQNQEGMYKINTDTQNRYNAMMNLDTEITKWFKLASKISFNSTNHKSPWVNSQKNTLWYAAKNEPGRNVSSPMKTASTDPNPDMWTDNIVGWLAYGATQDTKNTNMILNITPEIIVSPELQFRAEISYRPSDYFRKRVVPTREYIDGDWGTVVTTHTNPSYITEWTNHSDLYTINAYANFNKTIKKHAISGVAGFNQEWFNYRNNGGTKANGILKDELPVMNATNGDQFAYSDSNPTLLEHWAIRGAFFRANYIYDDKYLFEFNGRYDGTSRFAKDSRFKFFPSASAGWRISEELFMENTKEWLDNLKIRGSWGSLGNQNVDNYAYLAEYGSIGYVPYNMGGSRPMGIAPPGLVSPDLTWETATTFDIGVDFTLLQNRLDVVFDWYTRKTTDILMDGDKYPAVLGANAPKRNSGTLKTNGWEMTLNWRDRLSNGLRYDVGFTLSDYQTKVVKFEGNPNKLIDSLYDGMKMGEIWGYETVGILQESDFTIQDGVYTLNGPSQSKLGSTWYPGDVRYKDIGGEVDANGNNNPDGEISKGDETLENPGDRKIIGNNTPRLRFSLNGNVYWKNFDLNIFFQGVGKRDVWIEDSAFWGHPGNGGNRDLYNNSWTPERTNAKYPMYANRGQSRLVQTAYIFNGAYLRLKTLSLGYTVPRVWTEKAGIQHLRVNLSGYNLFEITKIPSVLDPDLISSAYPIMRSVAIGVQVKF